MKKILYFMVTVLLTVSCADSFLDIPPQHYSNESKFYQTQDHFEQALNGVYQNLRGLCGIPGFVTGEMRSDNTHYIRNNSDRGSQFRYREEVADFINDNQNEWSNEVYYISYIGISRANTLLYHLEGKDFPEDFKQKITGQTKFLRAYYYFTLVRTFGDVPLHTTPVTGPENAFLKRSPVKDVYTLILEDIKEAVNYLNVPRFPQDGRATEGSARMLLAKVLMTMPERDYPGAITQFREIMKMGYKLEDHYSDTFNPSNKNNRESLFEVQYQQGDQGQQSDWLYHFLPRTSTAEVLTGVPESTTLNMGGWNTPTQDLIDAYEPGDRRLDVSIAIAAGKNDDNGDFTPDAILPVGDSRLDNYPVNYPFINKYRHAHAKVFNTDDNWPIYRYSDVLLSLAECLLSENSGEALLLVNEVRSRAGLDPLDIVTEEAIAQERRIEFAFENQRWYDLVRTGKAIEVMNEYGRKTKALYPYLQERTYNVTTEKLLFAIPYREMQNNNLLEQNKGY